MVTAELLTARREAISGSSDLKRLLARVSERAKPVLARLPHIPEHKALLSKDGGVCAADGGGLTFDPWSPHEHRCRRCSATYRGERHDRWWARYQHLWLAERAAELAALAALTDDARAGARSAEILAEYGARYLRYPNRDNVLGPSRLFFSTYLESLWLCNYLAAAVMLREAGQLDDTVAKAVSQVADEAANLIGEFDEWFSNRQTWNNAALAAVAVWFEDEDLAHRAIEGRTGLLVHVARGFGRDGLWHEGENYHLFALRALLVGAGWAREAGIDLFAEPTFAARVTDALRAPARTALPDFTYPARKDSRFDVSLAQPAFLELWEIGLARLGERETESENRDLVSWLAALYAVPAPRPELWESYLHDAPLPEVPSPVSRSSLSWWSLLEMLPALPSDVPAWSPGSDLLDAQGLAILRSDGGYASLECGPWTEGHGHPDRLHLTLYAGGVPWLCDFGTGSYLTSDLAWYRSTLAHNAPRLDGVSQTGGDAMCEAFEARDRWSWVRGRWGDVSRTLVLGPGYVIDVLELAGRAERVLELPWHVAGEPRVVSPGRWRDGDLSDAFVSRVERFEPARPGPVEVEAALHGKVLAAHLVFDGVLLLAEGPGRPGSGRRETFFCTRVKGQAARVVTVLESVGEARLVRAVRAKGELIEVDTAAGTDRHQMGPGGWTVEGPSGKVRLGGRRKPEPPFEPLLEIDRPTKAAGVALRVDERPALDATLDGFDTSEPLTLDIEDQYRRSEEPYPGPEEYSAMAYVNWTDEALFVAVEVTKPELCLRPKDAAPLLLDNEPDDIHSDGLQVYLHDSEASPVAGFLVVPEDGGGLRVHGAALEGRWQRTDAGYVVTLALPFSAEAHPHAGGEIGFDLIVNEMLPGRTRRAGQLVWSGGNGWVYLRGDRQPASRLGVLELLG